MSSEIQICAGLKDLQPEPRPRKSPTGHTAIGTTDAFRDLQNFLKFTDSQLKGLKR
jgi:hypothetical protein